jgi:hypothetical protein
MAGRVLLWLACFEVFSLTVAVRLSLPAHKEGGAVSTLHLDHKSRIHIIDDICNDALFVLEPNLVTLPFRNRLGLFRVGEILLATTSGGCAKIQDVINVKESKSVHGILSTWMVTHILQNTGENVVQYRVKEIPASSIITASTHEINLKLSNLRSNHTRSLQDGIGIAPIEALAFNFKDGTVVEPEIEIAPGFVCRNCYSYLHGTAGVTLKIETVSLDTLLGGVLGKAADVACAADICGRVEKRVRQLTDEIENGVEHAKKTLETLLGFLGDVLPDLPCPFEPTTLLQCLAEQPDLPAFMLKFPPAVCPCQWFTKLASFEVPHAVSSVQLYAEVDTGAWATAIIYCYYLSKLQSN